MTTMIEKFPIKLVALALAALFLLWALFSGGQESLPEVQKVSGSVIQPIAEASANASEAGVLSGEIRARQKLADTEFDERTNADLKARFAKANQALKTDIFARL